MREKLLHPSAKQRLGWGSRIERDHFMDKHALKTAMETWIDSHGLTAVVDAICDVCYDKANHIRESYQDKALADQWEFAGLSLVNPREHYKDIKFPS